MKPNRRLVRILWVLLIWAGLSGRAHAFYDPSLGRWVNRDPIGESGFELMRGEDSTRPDREALYRFVQGDPIGAIDPVGLSPLSDCLDQARENALNCANSVRKWCGENIYRGRLQIIEDGMQCTGGGVSGIVKKSICVLLKIAVRALRGGGTVGGVVAGTAGCDLSYRAEIDACYTVHGPLIRPGPKY